MRIHATILQKGKTATGVQVPEDVVVAIGSGKRPKVRVTINGYTYRSSIAPLGGVSMLGISDEVRRNAGVAGGDEIDVDLELDLEPRDVTVPADFAAALETDPDARAAFDRLSYSNRLRHVLSIEGAKTDETRQRRVAKAIGELRTGANRTMTDAPKPEAG